MQPPSLSGCDGIVSLRICYKRQAQKIDTWSCIEVREFTKSQYAIVQLDHGLYDVKVVAINNENLSSASKTVTANLVSQLVTANQSTCKCLHMYLTKVLLRWFVYNCILLGNITLMRVRQRAVSLLCSSFLNKCTPFYSAIQLEIHLLVMPGTVIAVSSVLCGRQINAVTPLSTNVNRNGNVNNLNKLASHVFQSLDEFSKVSIYETSQ